MQSIPHRNPRRRRPTRLVLVPLLVVCGGVASAWAQDLGREDPAEHDLTEPLFDRSDFGNVAQQALSLYNQGMRSLERADSLARKSAEVENPKKRDKLLAQSAAANESAAQNFMEAISYQPEMAEAYSALGQAYRLLGKNQEALAVQEEALRRWPDDMDSFRSWAESLLALNRLQDATNDYAGYVDSSPERAHILMDEIKKWLAARQDDPGDIDPAALQRLSQWVAEREGKSG